MIQQENLKNYYFFKKLEKSSKYAKLQKYLKNSVLKIFQRNFGYPSFLANHFQKNYLR